MVGYPMRSVKRATEKITDEALPGFHLRTTKGIRGWLWLMKDERNNYLMVLAFQLLLSLVAPKCYCVGDWMLECGWSAGIFTVWQTCHGVTSPDAAELRGHLVEGHTMLFSPGWGAVFIFYFTLFQLFSFFSLLFSCLLQSSFQASLGRRRHTWL